MSDISRIGHAVWTGPMEQGRGLLTAENRAFTDLQYTFAGRTAGTSLRTDPEVLLATAHAGCFGMSLANLLSTSEHPPASVLTSAEVTLAPTAAGRRITRSEVTVKADVPGAESGEWFTAQVETADSRCLFSALVREAGGTVTVNAKLR